MPNDPVQLYPLNELAYAANQKVPNIISTPCQRYTIEAIDTPKKVPQCAIKKTGNLSHALTICIRARFMLTINMETEDHIINGSIGTIKHIYI